jgi:ankyrin repeat protein
MHQMSGTHVRLRFEWHRMPLIGDLRRWPTNGRDSKKHDNQAAMNSMQSFFTQLCPSPIPRRPAVLLVALAWSGLAFCGEIHDAAKAGDLAKVRALLTANPAWVSSKDTNGCKPLILAAGWGHKDVAALLPANKAEINAKGATGATPLHASVGNGQKDVVKLLLASKAEVNVFAAAAVGDLEKLARSMESWGRHASSRDQPRSDERS